MRNHNKIYRQYLIDLKQHRRSKYPYLSEFFKNLRIKEIVKEFEIKVKPLVLRLSKSLSYPKTLNEFDNSFEVKPISAKKPLKKVDKTDYTNYKKKTYLCEKCERFHRYLHQGKPSKTHKAHFKFFKEYKDKIPNYQLFKIEFKKKWKKTKNYEL